MRVRGKLPPGRQGQATRQHLPGCLHPRHSHTELELNLVLRGSATYLIGERLCRIGRGSLLWLFPDQEHNVIAKHDDYTVWIVHWSAELVRATCAAGSRAAILRESSPEGWFPRRVGDPQLRRLGAIFEEIGDAAEDPTLQNATLAYALASAWAIFQAGSELPPGIAVHPAVERACHLVGDGEDTRELSAEELARRCGVSYPRLSLLFSRQMGTTLSDYRARKRLDRFLATHDPRRDRLLDSALAAGFGSYSQFHRVFSRQLGLSPRAWHAAQAGA
jgi:AraC-like DNA-binding protein